MKKEKIKSFKDALIIICKNFSKQKLLRTAKTALSIAALMVGLQSKLKMGKVD